jgi:hypothetical protein
MPTSSQHLQDARRHLSPCRRTTSPRALDTSGESRALEYRRTNRKARAARWRAFLMALQRGSFSKLSVAFLRLVRCPEKCLTRRANQGHSRIIAKLLKPVRRNPRRAFSLEFSESDGGRTSRRHISHARRLSVVSAPSSEPFRSKLISRCARTCRHAAWPEPRPHAAPAAKG